jgi:hypothetical protein
LNITQVESRQKIDNAIFTFGFYQLGEDKVFGYKVYCSGSGSHQVEWFSPLEGDKLNELIDSLKNLSNGKFKRKIKIKNGWSNVNLHFLGFKPKKGIRIKCNISGFLFYSGAFGSSYISESDLERLIKNLERCLR